MELKINKRAKYGIILLEISSGCFMSDQSRKDLVIYCIYEEDERCICNFGQKIGMGSNY
jgi:hypothetical protein